MFAVGDVLFEGVEEVEVGLLHLDDVILGAVLIVHCGLKTGKEKSKKRRARFSKVSYAGDGEAIRLVIPLSIAVGKQTVF